MTTTVLIAGDHETFRSFARALLESEGFEVIGEARDGLSGVQAVRSLRPDLVVLDVQLPDLSGFEVLQRLRAEGVPTPVFPDLQPRRRELRRPGRLLWSRRVHS